MMITFLIKFSFIWTRALNRTSILRHKNLLITLEDQLLLTSFTTSSLAFIIIKVNVISIAVLISLNKVLDHSCYLRVFIHHAQSLIQSVSIVTLNISTVLKISLISL